jgi:riboflavin kinase/FMN adenylyltransferase
MSETHTHDSSPSGSGALDPGTAGTDGSVVIIGNFDGVHRGHVELIRTARSAEPGARLVAVTFWPHPMSVIRPDQTPPLLTTLPRREELLRAAGVDEVVVVEFTSEVASWSPDEFVDRVLRPLHPVRIVVGENFRFGFRASGTVDTLADLGRGQWKVQVVPLLTDGSHPSSSTLVRHAVAEGDFGRVRELSDQVFRFQGVVVQGDQRGREMGYPTANVAVEPGFAVPADGVYAGWVTRLDVPSPRWPAAISVGTNPTFDGLERRVEAYVLDRTDLELYGVPIAIDFYARMRGQVKYEGMASLIKQMRRDVDEIRELLSNH